MRKYLLVTLLVTGSVIAIGQEQVQAPGQGGQFKVCNNSGGTVTCLEVTKPDMVQPADVPESPEPGTGTPMPKNVGTPGGAGGSWSGGGDWFTGGFLTARGGGDTFRPGQTVHRTDLAAGAVGAATVFGPGGTLGMLYSMFPEFLTPHCSGPIPCSGGMVLPEGGIDVEGQVLGSANAIAIRKFGHSFDDIGALSLTERRLFFRNRIQGQVGLTLYQMYVKAARAVEAFGDISKISDPKQLRLVFGALEERTTAREGLNVWIRFMEDPEVDYELPNHLTH